MPTLQFQSILYFSPGDEAAMFSWLDSIPAVQRYWGAGNTLFVSVSRRASRASQLELLAITKRYGSVTEQQELLRMFPTLTSVL